MARLYISNHELALGFFRFYVHDWVRSLQRGLCKLADGHINPFVFACALTGVGLIGHLFCLAFYKFHMGEAVTLNVDKTGILMAVMAGVGIVIVDLAFFFAIRHGGIVSTNIVWSWSSYSNGSCGIFHIQRADELHKNLRYSLWSFVCDIAVEIKRLKKGPE